MLIENASGPNPTVVGKPLNVRKGVGIALPMVASGSHPGIVDKDCLCDSFSHYKIPICWVFLWPLAHALGFRATDGVHLAVRRKISVEALRRRGDFSKSP